MMLQPERARSRQGSSCVANVQRSSLSEDVATLKAAGFQLESFRLDFSFAALNLTPISIGWPWTSVPQTQALAEILGRAGRMSSWTLRAQSPVLEVDPLLGEQKAYWLLDLSRQSDRSPASSPGTVAKLSHADV